MTTHMGFENIIGQTAGGTLRVLGGTLGQLRSPSLPTSISGALFETHWLAWVVLLVVGLAVWYRGRTLGAQGVTTARVGAIVAGVALVWAGLAMVVDTPAERLYKAHTGMAAAADKGDMDRLVGYLADDFRCPQLGIETLGDSREELSTRLKSYGIKENHIMNYHTVISGDEATVKVAILTTMDTGPITTTWRLVWADVPGADWRIKTAELLKIGDQDVGDLKIPQNRGDMSGF